MNNKDYIPDTDTGFDQWQSGLIENAEPNLTAWGIPTEDFTGLKAKQAPWESAFAKSKNLQTRTRADVQAKDDARQNYEKSLRSFVSQWLANNAKVSNADRERLGLTVRSNTRTPSPEPVTRPVATIDFSIRLRHTINFADEATPRSRAKPNGMHGCEIWVKIDGEAPKDASELTYLATDTNSPYVANFGGKDAGKVAYYWLRWINTRNQPGPWSSTISAMIVG
ncbi:MAG TPA: hypothetical protein VIH57_06330 [Bacteroidales bacterium]